MKGGQLIMSVERTVEKEVRVQPPAYIEDIPPLKHGDRLNAGGV